LARIEVLVVGRELLIGRTLDTNVYWLGRRLALVGGMIKEITTVDDQLDEIAEGLRACLSRRPTVLVTIGGLGPTPDDMTSRGVARGLGRRMSVNGKALSLVKDHYAKRGMAAIRITPARRKMATLPAGAEPLPNGVGTAPGMKIMAGRTSIFCLPGVPSEMKDIFKNFVEPEIKRRLGRLYRKAVTYRVEGIFESTLAPLIGRELKRYPGIYIKSHPRGTKGGRSRIELDIVSVKTSRREAERVAGSCAREMATAMRVEGATVKLIRTRTS